MSLLLLMCVTVSVFVSFIIFFLFLLLLLLLLLCGRAVDYPKARVSGRRLNLKCLSIISVLM